MTEKGHSQHIITLKKNLVSVVSDRFCRTNIICTLEGIFMMEFMRQEEASRASLCRRQSHSVLGKRSE